MNAPRNSKYFNGDSKLQTLSGPKAMRDEGEAPKSPIA